MDQGSSLLLGIEGLVVVDVRVDADGRRVAQCVTDPGLAGWCPLCGEQPTSPKGWETTRPRDVVIGPDVPILTWRIRKWRCKVDWCQRKSFTKSRPSSFACPPGGVMPKPAERISVMASFSVICARPGLVCRPSVSNAVVTPN